MHNPSLVKTFKAVGIINPSRIVKLSTDMGVVQAEAGTDTLIGVTDRIYAAEGESVDVILSGIAEIEAGGTISVGNLITSDANGKAVSAVNGSTFTPGRLPTFTAGTFTAGSLASYTDNTFTAGTLPSHSADQFYAGTLSTFTETANRVIGIALSSGTNGEFISVLISQS